MTAASRTLAIALGNRPRSDIQVAIDRQFGPLEVTWFDRAQLRRRPVGCLAWLMRRRFDSAVLVASDLRQPRLRLTSFVLSLPRARRRWRIDLRGNCEAWSLGRHLADSGVPIARHAAACSLALVLAGPLLRTLDVMVRPRPRPARRRGRLLYLRSQLWLGLEGGGSVAHTAGVIGGLEAAGVQVQVVSSDRLPGVAAPTNVVAPETWFDGALREIEDLAYNVAFFVVALRTARRAALRAIYQRHSAFNCSGALLSRLLGVPLVLEFNSSEVWKGRYWGGLHFARLAALVERINLRAADSVVVVSDALREYVLARHDVPAAHILLSPNGVDPGQFRPELDGADVRRRLNLESSVVVGFSGTFGEWHGIPTLASILSDVLAARRHVRWLLIGDGPLRRLVEHAVETHGLGDRVVRVGLVPHASMPAYLAACDILVSPHGRQADGGEFFGSPTKLFEYMAAGRPIVASRIGQIAQVLTDGHSALLVPPDDPDALREAILRLVDDACLRARLARSARQTAETQHTWRQNAERVLAELGAAG